MKLPVEWLREFVTTDLSDEALADKLTMAGLEVEEITYSPSPEGRGGAGLFSEAGAVYHTKVTPNRGDWLSVVGVAREAAAALDVPLKWQPPVLPDEDQDVRKWAGVRVVDPHLCPRYAGKVIRNVKHRPTPDWMRERLLAAGMRPIDIVVDITNYVMLELGQPLHAFNYDALPEGQVIVRPTAAGEKIVTLDGVERELPAGSLAICDIEKPVCIAGVMGNAETEVTTQTRNIFLEAAHFDALSIRRTSKLLGLSTEASYRFERTVDPNVVPIALERAADLLADLADGEVVLGRIDLNPSPVLPREIPLRPKRVNAILGTGLSNAVISHSLRRLGLQVADSGDPFLVTVPTFRPDLVKEIDLIEEVARMSGYENLPEAIPVSSGFGAGDEPIGVFTTDLRRILAGLGLQEVFTHTLAAPSAFDDPMIVAKRVAIRSALSAELSGLRTALLPNVLDVTALNLRHKQTDVRVFEIGKTFLLGETPGSYSETRHLAGALAGQEVPRSWADADRKPVTFYTAKGIVEAIFTNLRVPPPMFTPSSIHGMHPGRSAGISIDGRRIGYVAEVDPDAVKRDLDVPAGVGRIAVFEIDAEALMALAVDNRRYRPLPKYPPVSRDLAIAVDLGVEYGRIDRLARAATDPNTLEELAVQSVYTGERIEAGKKSVAVRLTFRAPDRTLTDSEVDAWMSAVETALAQGVGAIRR